MLSSVKLHNCLTVLSVMRLILSALGTFWQATFVTEQEITITLLLSGQIIEKVGTLQTHSALTPAWSWCDSARNRCSLLQSFSCETWKHCLRHSVHFLIDRAAKAQNLVTYPRAPRKSHTWESRTGSDLLPFNRASNPLACFEEKYPSRSQFFGHPVSACRDETRVWPTGSAHVQNRKADGHPSRVWWHSMDHRTSVGLLQKLWC